MNWPKLIGQALVVLVQVLKPKPGPRVTPIPPPKDPK